MPVLYTPSPPFTPPPVPAAAGTFPQVIVEAAFTSGPTGTGQFDLILDDPTFGILDTDVLADSAQWTDITPWVQQGSINRTFTRQQGPLTTYQGGTATFTLNNSDGRFDPANLASPYASAGVSSVRPMIPVRVRAVWASVTYVVFGGFATSWTPPAENFGPVYDQTVLACGDAFRIFTGVTLPQVGAVGGGELTGARIARVAAAAGWYSVARGQSVIADGASTLQATTFNDTALNLMQLAADCEVGELYVDNQGRLAFRGRNDVLTDTRSNTVQGVFGGQPGTAHTGSSGGTYGSTYGGTYGGTGIEYECTLLSRPDDDTTMANDIQAQNVSGVMQEVTDEAAVSKFLFPRTYQRTDLILETDPDALNWANYILALAASDEFRFDEVTITPGVDPADLFPQALGRELGDRIQVWKRPPGVAPYSKDLFIRGIQHDFTPTFWQTTWATQNAARYSFFVLDDAILGVLDANALGF